MSAVEDVLSRVRISEIYQALTGIEPRRTGQDTWRGAATWRNGDGLNVSGDDARGVWHDFKTDEGGGVLDLVQRVRGCSRADALRWCADLAGVPLSQDKPLSAEARARWARELRELERDLPTARYWRRAAVNMAEQLLTTLKAALFDPTLPWPDVGEIAHIENMLTGLRRKDGPALVAEYRSWLDQCPGMTAALVHEAKCRERGERRALLVYLKQTAPAAGKAAV
jgi:hypothetical protein